MGAEDNGKSTALAPVRTAALELSAKDAQAKLLAIREFQNVVHKTFIEGHDFGVIPGTPKPTLLKPGAEKIAKLLNLQDDYDIIEKIEDWENGFFYYMVRCRLSDLFSGTLISAGMGSCNSRESRYAFRWVPLEKVPPSLNKDDLEVRGGKRKFFEPDFALAKKETTGQYGKPALYWENFANQIKDKRAVRILKKKLGKKEFDGYEITVDAMEYRIPNKDLYDQVNTFLKMAKKRALVDGALSVGRLSDLFTQDIEEFIGEPEPGEPLDVETEAKKAGAEAGQEPPPGPEDKPVEHPENAPISEETKNQIAALIAQACLGGKRTTEKVIAQIKEWVKFASNRDVAKVPDDLTQDEAARVIASLTNLKDRK